MPLNFVQKNITVFLRKKIILAICYGLGVFSLTGSVVAQCVSTEAALIPDNDLIEVNFSVSGLIDNDLGSPTQGICGVEIDFMHEYLGDLTILLVSPSGTTVQLVGQVTTAITPTNLSRWNISFAPCMAAANPDAGFAATWSNLQPWQVFTTYTGVYHPNTGCLEDFNSGSANGVWKIIFEDHDVLQTGSVARVSLIFCNPAGLACNACEPNAGTISPPVLFLCEGDLLQTSDFSIDFQGNPPSPGFYSYVYLLNSGNSITESGSAIFAAPSPGSYTLCGLSYLSSDAPQVNALLGNGDYNQLLQAISNGSICAEQTDPCVVIQVRPLPDTAQIDVLLCKGRTFLFKGQVYSVPGIYHVTDDEIGCDSIFRLEITASDLIATVVTPDSLTCGSTGVLLDGSFSSGSNGPLTFHWTTQNGIISGDPFTSQVIATVPGTYRLTVRDGTCEESKDVVVHGVANYPRIFLEGGVITCAEPLVSIHPVVFPSNVTYFWTGPGGFTSMSRDIDVSVPGRYFLRIVTMNGCEAFSYIDIAENITAPNATIIAFKNCANSSAIIGSAFPGNYTYAWGGPDASYPPNVGVTITSPGLYTLTLTDLANGCTGTGSYFFDANYDIPPIVISGIDSLRCNQQVTIAMETAAIAGLPLWLGPNGFSYNGFNVSLTQPGIYTVSVAGVNGCTNRDTVEIIASENYPDYVMVHDTVSCAQPNAIVGIIMPGADLFHWQGITSADSNSAFVQVTLPGIYEVTAIDTHSNCIIESTAFVFPDLAPPQFNLKVDSISCNNATGTLTFLPLAGQTYTAIEWQYPDMTIVQNPVIPGNGPGQYLLTVTGLNGCMRSSYATLDSDTIPPLFFLEADSIGCDNMGFINSIRIDSLDAISWSGPAGFTSSALIPTIADTGLYVATGFGTNGCPSTQSIFVHGDVELPDLQVTFEELTCLKPDAELLAMSADSVISYTWFDQGGNIIGSDSMIAVTDAGNYRIEVEGDNHCIAKDTIELTLPVYPDVIVSADTLSCTDEEALIAASSNGIDPQYAWLDRNGDTLVWSNMLLVNNPGPFIISVKDVNGCVTRDTLTVPADTLFPQVVIDIVGEVRCQNRDFMLDASASTPSNIEFTWETTGGMILSQTDLPVIQGRDTGVYIVTIRNPENGCTQKDSIHVTEHPDAITLAYINVKRPVCPGDENAEILVTTFEGGVGPFIYTLNGTLTQTDKHFKGLPGGNHLLEIMDAAGCIYDTTVFVKPSSPYIVDAGPDQEIYIGESALLFGSSDIPSDEFLTQDWDSTGMIFCPGCAQTNVSPYETSIYKFLVTSVTGCVMEDLVTVYVLEEGQFFIPNIFTPNKDGINDEVRFNASSGIAKVLNWNIFDRWGNAVFGKTNFLPDDISVYWDGSAQGSEMLNPGVFAYIVEIELVNGTRRIHHGTITLLK